MKFIRYETAYFCDSFFDYLYGIAFRLRTAGSKLPTRRLIGWRFHATKLDGTPHDTKGRETQIFERSADGSWRLVHIHYSAVGSR
ncbi:MAG: hypothetical protein SO287_04065 [Parabacteroides sp.]|nr:hypothetical protein [Parabacteroides sp.]